MNQPRPQRTAAPERPRLFVVPTHPLGCDCDECEPYVPSVAPRLTAVEIAGVAIAGVGLVCAAAALMWIAASGWHGLVALLAGPAL